MTRPRSHGVAKMTDFKVYLQRRYARNQKLHRVSEKQAKLFLL